MGSRHGGWAVTFARRGFLAYGIAIWVVALALSGIGAPVAHAQTSTSTSTTAGPAGTTTTTTKGPDTRNPGLAAGSMLLAAFGILAVVFLVHHDRSGARKAQLEALRLGAESSVQGEALASAAQAEAAAAQAEAAAAGRVSIKATDTTLEVGKLSNELIFMVGEVETAATWGVDPAGRVTFVPAGGQHSRVQVKGVTEGPADVHASTPTATGPAHHSITVTKAKVDPKGLTFLVLGSGIGAYVIAVVAVALTAALGFVGKLNSETIAVVLGTAVGAGATAAATKTGQSPAADKDAKADKKTD
jgi:hypothetical protein